VKPLRLFDVPWQVPALSAALIGVGLLFVPSADQGTRLEGVALRQIQVVAGAAPALLVFGALSHRRLAKLAFPLYGLGLAALVAVLLLGVNVGGARRWFQAPFDFKVQPSELAKPLLVLALARWLEFRGAPERWRDWLVPIVLTAAPFLLVKAEPDLGTALLLVPILAAMLYAAGARKLHYVTALLVIVVALPAIWFSPLLHDYQRDRVRTFLVDSAPQLEAKALEARGRAAASDEKEAKAAAIGEARALERARRELQRGAGYQAHSSQTAIGSGGAWGKGLRQGPQNRLAYLPARQTDFVFAVVAEEWGFAGGASVVLLFVLLGFSFLSVAASTRDRFSQLASVGAAASLVPQAFANVAMACGLFPVTGIPLPFVSYGGSSLLSSFLLLGVVVSAARSRRDAEPFLYRSWRADERFDPFHARAAAEPLRDVAL
jgi:rod shape determining protein RodA